MKKYPLGEFEEIVLLTVAVLYDDAYGVSIKKEFETRLNRSVSVGALQSALKRLEEKGYLKSHEGEATKERNVPLGSAHRSSDALVAYTGRGAINDISMCWSTGSRFSLSLNVL